MAKRLQIAAALVVWVTVSASGGGPAPGQTVTGGACDFGSPSPYAPEELAQYSFIIGDFEIRARGWSADGWTEQYRTARWTGRYILGGMAIMEEWYDFPPEVAPDTGRGVNIRVFDPDESIWKLMWIRTDQRQVTELRSELRNDGRMYLWRIYPTPDDRLVYFEFYEDGHWARLNFNRDEETDTWVPDYKLEAYRLPCE